MLFCVVPGSAPGSFDLLPTPSLGQKWTEDLLTDEGHDSEQIYEFDGEESAVVIPEKYAPGNLTSQFSIAFWMKHGETEGLNKEHILCNSDSEGESHVPFEKKTHHNTNLLATV